MKKKVLRRTIPLALTCAMSIALVPLTTRAGAEFAVPVYADGTRRFETELYLAAWCEPHGTQQQIEWYKDAGFNTVVTLQKIAYNTNEFYQYLDLCAKNDIYVVYGSGNSKEGLPSSIRSATYDLDVPGFYGVECIDEPLGGEDAEYNIVMGGYKPYKVKVVKGLDDPNSWTIGADGKFVTPWEFEKDANGDYVYKMSTEYVYKNWYEYILDEYAAFKAYNFQAKDKYGLPVDPIFEVDICNGIDPGSFGYEVLKTYCKLVLPKMEQQDRCLAFDIYPFEVDANGNFYENSNYAKKLLEFRYYTDLYDVEKTIHYYQTWMRDEMIDYLDESSISYQFYTSMCFGNKGFTSWYYNYYYNDPESPYEVMLDEWGQRTDVWYYNQAAMEEIKAFDNVYLQFCDDWQGIMPVFGTNGKGKNNDFFKGLYTGNWTIEDKTYFDRAILKSHERISSVNATNDTLIGCMKDGEGRDGFVIANVESIYTRRNDVVEVTFNNATHAMVWEEGVYRLQKLDNGKLTLDLAVGDGAFVIPL